MNLPRKWLWGCVVVTLFCAGLANAEVTVRVSWERPVNFKLVDAETGEALPKALLVVITEKIEESARQPVLFYDVFERSAAGLVAYPASEKISGVEVRAAATGYALLSQKISWQDLPARQKDQYGLDIGKPPEIPLALKNLSRSGRWPSHFRLVLGPELDELMLQKPPQLSPDEKRLIGEFLNRERNRMLGF